MQHFNPTHFAQTKRDGLTFQQWFDAYNVERARLGLKPSKDTHINSERYELNETPADMAEVDRAKGWEA